MKTKTIGKENGVVGFTKTINTDDLISDYEFMYQMFRMQMKLDIDNDITERGNKAKKQNQKI
jgi:hypothetical protein